MDTNMTVIQKAERIADAVHHVMGAELGLQTPVRYLLTRDNNFIFVIGVMDVQNLHGSLNKYKNEGLLHQISTAVGGLPVALSNHSGLRYAVSMTKPKLPKRIDLVELPSERDMIPFGISLRGAAGYHAKKIVNLIIGGSQDSGKSTMLRLLAHVNRAHGAKLYLADPYAHTFNPDVWNRFTALPVAGKRAEVLQLIEAMQAEIESRSAAFRSAAVNGIVPEDIDEFNTVTGENMPRLWLIGDEMNGLLADRVMQERMMELARGGRKWGVHVALAAHTWRDADIPRGLSAMFPSRLCLRVADDTSGRVTLGDSHRGREPLKFRTQGRAILLANGLYQKVQLYYVSPDQQRAWLESAVDGEPLTVESPLPAIETDLVRRALENEEGRMSIPLLVSWGKSEREARDLVEKWERRGWLEKDPTRKNARYITAKLRGILSNGQTGQTGSNTHPWVQTAVKLGQTPNMGVA